MKLIRFGSVGLEKPGIQLSDGSRIDVSSFGSDYDENFFGNEGLEKLEKWLESNKDNCPIIDENVRLVWTTLSCLESFKDTCISVPFLEKTVK